MEPSPAGGNMLDLENLTQQEQISFLEAFIREINRTLDEITQGRDIPRQIKGLKLRVKVLEDDDADKYAERISKLRAQLKELEEFWAEKEPIINLLQEERSLYRNILNSI
jgi:polyhydroxyalkanoate synthesis regulator phasin